MKNFFSIKYRAVFFIALGVLLGVFLGFWQLNRAEQKREQYESFIVRQAKPPIKLDTLYKSKHMKSIIWQRVSATGYFNVDKQFLLDNQVSKGLPGYFVFTPFSVVGESRQFLVNRGWIPAGVNRSQIPDLSVSTLPVQIDAVIKPPPRVGIILKQTLPEQVATGVYRVNEINPQSLATLGYSFEPYVLRLEPSSEEGYRLSWVAPGSGEARHIGYSFQWFALASALFIGYLSYCVNAYRLKGKTLNEKK